MIIKNNCTLMSRELKDENKVKHAYKTNKCTINVTSAFGTEKSIRDLLISNIVSKDIKIDFKLA